MIGFSAVAEPLAKAFGISSTLVSFSVMIYFLIYIPVNFLSNYVIDNYGAAPALRIAALLLLVGCWVRISYDMFGEASFIFIFIGQAFGAIGSPFTLNAPTKLASTWFAPDQRGMATALGSLGIPFGCVIGFVIPSFFIDSTKEGPQNLAGFKTYLYVQNIIATIPCVLALLFTRAKPPSPPAYERPKTTIN